MNATASSSPATACCCCGGCGGTAAPARPAPIEGHFDLIDHFGRRVDHRAYGERYLLVFFGFTHCALVCPRELAKLGRALAAIGPLAQRVQPLYVSVDPARDDPPTMQRFLAGYDGGFVGLTGSPAQAEAAQRSFRVFAERRADPGAPDGYVVPHTAFAYLMAPGGRYLAHFPESLDDAAVADRLRRLLS